MKAYFVSILLAIGVYILIQSYSTADSGRLSSLELKLKETKSVKGSALLKDFLKENPTPTNSQIETIEEEINKIILLEKSIQITGDSSLKAEHLDTTKLSISKSGPSNKNPDLNNFISNLTGIYIALFALLISFFGIRFYWRLSKAQ
jgi:hypothetical protein